MSDTMLYTPEMANQALALVGRIVQDMEYVGRRIKRMAFEQVKTGTEDPGLYQTACEFSDLLKELAQIGVRYEDVHRLGVVDFPAFIDGEEVMLCWRSDEDQVTHYHGTEGYVGRRPLKDVEQRT